MINLIRILTFVVAVAITISGIFFIDADREFAQAKQAYKSGDMDQALRMARRANRAFSEDNKKIAAFYLQARAASKMNWDKQAKIYLDHLLKIDKENTRALLYRGELEFKLGKDQDALRDLNKGLNAAPDNISATERAYFLSQRGLAHLSLKQPFEAEKDAIEALNLATNLPEAHDLMSKVFEQKGEIKKALDECESAYQLSLENNKLFFTTPEGRLLSDRLVKLRGKYLLSK